MWRHDGRSPLYVADRAARGGETFRMVKIRSMVANADQLGAASTAGDDARITAVGRFIRRWKIDELSQLWNELAGDMSLVGPRPQVLSEVASYTQRECNFLTVEPGVTDFSSIVVADEGEILRGSANPDLDYRRLIRPRKSQLGLFYVERRSFTVDIRLIVLTVLRIIAPTRALVATSRLRASLGAPTSWCASHAARRR